MRIVLVIGLVLVVAVLAASYVWWQRSAGAGRLPASGRAPAPPGDLDRWVAAGLISGEQADAIESFERRAAPPPRKVSLVTEALAYVGAGLAIAGGGVGLGQIWEDLGEVARVAIVAGAALALLVAGLFLLRPEEPALRRLKSVLWLLSVGGVAAALFLLTHEVLDRPERTATLWMGLGTTAYAGTLWLVLQRVLQQVALFVSMHMALLGGLFFALEDPPAWAAAMIAWGLGALWVILGWRRVIEPVWAAVPLGALGAVVAPTIGAEEHGWLFVVAFATTGALIGASVMFRITPLLAIGAVWTFVYVTWAVVKYFGESLGVPVALALAGATILILALAATRLGRFTRPVGPRAPLGHAA